MTVQATDRTTRVPDLVAADRSALAASDDVLASLRLDTASAGTFAVHDPATNTPIAHVPNRTSDAALDAVATADSAGRAWARTPTRVRADILRRWYELLVASADDLALVCAAEDSVVAADFIDGAIARNGVATHTVHADRGTSMTSKPVSVLLADLGITRSHSRPRVSNDNPFSEAQFKTLKYVHDFPHHFDSLAGARDFCDGFFTEYNHVHHHSGIGWHTPASVHYGTYGAIDDARQQTLTQAWQEHPERFTHQPRPPQIKTEVWINEPVKETELAPTASTKTI